MWRRLDGAPQIISSVSGALPTRRYALRATKKPRLMREGATKCLLLLIFLKPMALELELAPDIETKVQSVAVVSSGQSLDHSS
jgi:hypothetical protein